MDKPGFWRVGQQYFSWNYTCLSCQGSPWIVSPTQQQGGCCCAVDDENRNSHSIQQYGKSHVGGLNYFARKDIQSNVDLHNSNLNSQFCQENPIIFKRQKANQKSFIVANSFMVIMSQQEHNCTSLVFQPWNLVPSPPCDLVKTSRIIQNWILESIVCYHLLNIWSFNKLKCRSWLSSPEISSLTFSYI